MMSNAKLNAKEAIAFIKQERHAGKTDQEIYDLLSAQYDNKKAIVNLITGLATDEVVNKYRVHNYLFLGLLIIAVILELIEAANSPNSFGGFQILLGFALFMVVILVISGIYQGLGVYYRICGWMLIGHIAGSISFTPEPFNIAQNIVAAIAAGMAFYLSNSMFHKLNTRRKPDANGDYILD